MIDRIGDIEKASEDIRKYYRSILDGRLLSIDVEKKADEELISLLPNGFSNRNRGFRYADNLCSWYIIGESKEFRWFNTYKKVFFGGENVDTPLGINYSMFRFPLYFNREKYVIFANRTGTSTIDNKIIEPESFFSNHVGEKILYICGISGVDKFGLEKVCVYFAKDNVTPDYIRRYIFEAQIITLVEFLDNPIKYSSLPPTDIIRECEGGPYFFKDVPNHPLMEKLANRICSEEFLESFKEKYVNLLSRYAYFCKQ